MGADEYLYTILNREAVDTGPLSPARCDGRSAARSLGLRSQSLTEERGACRPLSVKH